MYLEFKKRYTYGSHSNGISENISRDKEVGGSEVWIESRRTSSIRKKGAKGGATQNRGPKSKILRDSTKPKACATGRTNQAAKELEIEKETVSIVTTPKHHKRSAVLLNLLHWYTRQNHAFGVTCMRWWGRRLQHGCVGVMSWVAGKWGMSRVSSWRRRRCKKRCPQLP